MKILPENLKQKLSGLAPILPYGVTESWEDLNPRLYHAIHIYWLKFYGMWYNDFSPKTILFWLQLLYTLISLWLVCFLPGIGEVVYLLSRRENIGDVAEGLYLFLSEMYTYCKIAVFWMNRGKIMELLGYLCCEEFKPEETEHKNIIRRSIVRARGVMTYYTIMCVGAVSVAIIMPLTENFEVLPTNVEYPFFSVYNTPAYEIIYAHHETCFNSYGPIAVHYWPCHSHHAEQARWCPQYLYRRCCLHRKHCCPPLSRLLRHPRVDIGSCYFTLPPPQGTFIGFIIVYTKKHLYVMCSQCNEVYYKPATCIIDGVMDTLLAAFVAAAIGQIEILSYNIRNFMVLAERRRNRDISENKYSGYTSEYYARNVLRGSIIHHNSIVTYVSMIEGAFSLASALQFMLSVMVLCLIGIQFLSIEEPMRHPMQIAWMGIYLTCMLTEFFILCWFGDELIWKSLELRQAAFEAPWMDISPKTSMYIIIFLERCNRPLRVSAGKIFTLSLDTYTILINWAYKAFAVMRNMKK